MANAVEYILKMKDLISPKLRNITEQANRLDNTIGSVGKKSSMIGDFVKGTLITQGLNAVGGAITGVIEKTIDATAEYQKFQAVLATTLGSETKANEAMKMIQKVADVTNFTSTELTDNFIKLANRNVVLKSDEIMRMADVANATGKDIGQLSEAILDISNSERWKNIGIQSEKVGNKVRLTWKGVTKEVDNTEMAVKNAVIAFGSMQGVVGMTDKISNTVGGKLSTLADNWNGIFIDIGKNTGGVIMEIISKLDKLVSIIRNNGTEIIFVIAGITTAFVAYKVVTLSSILATEGLTGAFALLNAVMSLNPVGLIVAGLSLLVVGIGYAWKKIDGFRHSLIGLWAGLKQVFENIGNFFKKIFAPIGEALDAFDRKDYKGMGKAVMQLGYNISPIGMASNMKSFIQEGGLTKGVSESFEKAIVNAKKIELRESQNAVNPYKIGSKEWYDFERDLNKKIATERKAQTEKPKSVEKLGVNGSSVGRESKIVNINIGSLVKDLQIVVSNTEKGIANMKEEVAKALLSAVNDVSSI